MHTFPRRIGAALIGAIVVAALTLTMTSQAHAADQTVKLTQVRASDGHKYALSVDNYLPTGQLHVVAKTRNDSPSITQQRWIKHDIGDARYAAYESVKYPGQCMQVLTNSSGEPVTLGPCQPSYSRQMWTQGFVGGTFRKLENLESSRAVTRNGAAWATQTFYADLETQGWAIVGI